jgi:hypothetical protein
VLDARSDSIDVLRRRGDGSLEPRGHVSGLPASSVGVAAR